jgi:two-component system phosphate regulon response regulator PhoB
MKHTGHILIIEDEADICMMIEFSLKPYGYHFVAAKDIASATAAIVAQTPDLILLDWMLPDGTGIDFLAALKKKKSTAHIPVIMLTAKAEEHNKIAGLKQGADDYITKPFSPKELAARVHALLRRTKPTITDPQTTYQLNEISVDTHSHQVHIGNSPCQLSEIEYKLLLFFIKNPQRTFSREQLITAVWENRDIIDPRTVDVTIGRLRQHLTISQQDRALKTIRGFGYQFIHLNPAAAHE